MNETVAQLPSPQAETGQKPVGFEILPAEAKGLSLKHALLWAAGAIVCFHIAYAFHALAFVIVGYLFGLIQLTRVSTARHAVWLGFGVGFLTAAPQLTCFWTLFGAGALALWSILGFWIGLFVVLGRLCLRRFGLQR